MSQPLYQPPTAQFPPSRGPGQKWPWIVGIIAALILGIGIGVLSAGLRSNAATPTDQSPTPPPAAIVGGKPTSTTTTTVPPMVVLPKPADFTINVKVLEKKCFGSAGCHVTYQIDPKYVGDSALPTGREITVVYQISGGEDLQVNRFTVEGGTASFPKEESIQTKSSKSELTAKATEVF